MVFLAVHRYFDIFSHKEKKILKIRFYDLLIIKMFNSRLWNKHNMKCFSVFTWSTILSCECNPPCISPSLQWRWKQCHSCFVRNLRLATLHFQKPQLFFVHHKSLLKKIRKRFQTKINVLSQLKRVQRFLSFWRASKVYFFIKQHHFLKRKLSLAN